MQDQVQFLNECYNLMMKHQVIMIYEGKFSQDITKSVLSMTERSFTEENVNDAVKKRVYNIMTELLQNICKHEFKDVNEIDGMESLFMISSTENEYHIITGNSLKENVIEVIVNKIKKVNSLDAEGLKQFYKETRLSTTISEVGGAGLGFIDIARKSTNPISYHFKRVNGDIWSFTQLVTVNKN